MDVNKTRFLSLKKTKFSLMANLTKGKGINNFIDFLQLLDSQKKLLRKQQ